MEHHKTFQKVFWVRGGGNQKKGREEKKNRGKRKKGGKALNTQRKALGEDPGQGKKKGVERECQKDVPCGRQLSPQPPQPTEKNG